MLNNKKLNKTKTPCRLQDVFYYNMYRFSFSRFPSDKSRDEIQGNFITAYS